MIWNADPHHNHSYEMGTIRDLREESSNLPEQISYILIFCSFNCHDLEIYFSGGNACQADTRPQVRFPVQHNKIQFFPPENSNVTISNTKVNLFLEVTTPSHSAISKIIAGCADMCPCHGRDEGLVGKGSQVFSQPRPAIVLLISP